MAVQKKKIKDFENYYIYGDGRVQIRKTAYGYKWIKVSECNGGDYYSYSSKNSTETVSNQKM